MKRRPGTGGKPIKGQHRKALKPKCRDAPNRVSSSTPIWETVARRTRELNEAIEQQSATSEVLHVISSAPSDLDPVLKAILGNATRLCQANFGVMFLVQGDAFRTAATHNAPQAFVEARRRNPRVSMTGKSGLA